MLPHTRVAISTSVLACAAILAALTHSATAQAVKNITTHNDWAVYTDGEQPHKFCFVTSVPKSTDPAGASRNPPRAYISAWPKDGIKSEVSFRMGFPVKSTSGGTAVVSAATFEMFATDDRVYVSDATAELKLVEAMRLGDNLTVRVTSERGTVVTDTYSLSGISAALKKLQDTCF